VEPLPVGTSFVNAYQLWLHSNYPANDGIGGMLDGPDEGVVHYCANNNTARMNGICHRNVGTLHATIRTYSTTPKVEHRNGIQVDEQGNGQSQRVEAENDLCGGMLQ
jgi:hypothetical protein